MISRLLIERECSIHVSIDSVTSIDRIECLCIVIAQMEVVDVLSKSVNVVILPSESASTGANVVGSNSHIHHVRSELEELIFVHNDVAVS